jgi:transcriptional regulator with XRE-family HTH domain
MEFGDQIKELRKRNSLTQDELADKLHVTRQAVSNWENDRNLPDLEMLIDISREFHVSLDQLILGGNDMTEKLIQDGSETRRAKMNLISAFIGGVLMLMGLMCFFIKMNSVEYVDETGLLHENFYLIPVGFLFVLSGVIIIATAGIRHLIEKKKQNRISTGK